MELDRGHDSLLLLFFSLSASLADSLAFSAAQHDEGAMGWSADCKRGARLRVGEAARERETARVRGATATARKHVRRAGSCWGELEEEEKGTGAAKGRWTLVMAVRCAPDERAKRR